MPNKKVCDFDLRDGGFFHNRLEKLSDGHYICKYCKAIIKKYNLPLRFDIFQMLVTAQAQMVDTVMDSYLKNHSVEEIIATHYPLPKMKLHNGEHCINAVSASQIIMLNQLPKQKITTSIAEIEKSSIANIADAKERSGSQKIEGILYETEAALYFISENYINVHRLGYIKRNLADNEYIHVNTPTKNFTYKVQFTDMFFLRERFFQKVNNIINHKDNKLIFISNDNLFTVTPGIYDVPKNLKPGEYNVKAIRDAGLHIKDIHGHVKDYDENEESITLPDGGILEVTGEYQLEWIDKKTNKH